MNCHVSSYTNFPSYNYFLFILPSINLYHFLKSNVLDDLMTPEVLQRIDQWLYWLKHSVQEHIVPSNNYLICSKGFNWRYTSLAVLDSNFLESLSCDTNKPIEPICHFEIVVTAAKCLLRVKPEQTRAKVERRAPNEINPGSSKAS